MIDASSAELVNAEPPEAFGELTILWVCPESFDCSELDMTIETLSIPSFFLQ